MAGQYLNTPYRGKETAVLAHQLFTVLDRRLPAVLNEISDQPEGSLANPLLRGHELVGTVSSNDGKVDIWLEHVDRGSSGFVWLFSG